MSVQAISWAYAQTVPGSKQCAPPVVKFVLVTLANYAGMEGELWPSVETLAKETQLSERSVRDAIHVLFAHGLAADTTVRRGRTKRVRVLKLNAAGSSTFPEGNAAGPSTEMRLDQPVEPLGEPLVVLGGEKRGPRTNGHTPTDPIALALVEVTGPWPEGNGAAGQYRAAWRDLRADHATPEGIRFVALALRNKPGGGWAVTPTSISKWYTQLAPRTEPVGTCDHGRRIGYDCPACRDREEQRTIDVMVGGTRLDA